MNRDNGRILRECNGPSTQGRSHLSSSLVHWPLEIEQGQWATKPPGAVTYAPTDHVGEAPGQGAGCGKIRNGGFDPGHGDSVGPREMIARRRHHAGDPARRRAYARRGVGRRFRAPLSCRPFADDAQASPEPLCAKTAPQFGAIPATAFPFPREPGQPRLETALA